GLVLGLLDQAGPGLDADDAAVEQVGVVRQVGDAVHVLDVGRDGQLQGGALVPGAEVLQLLAVLVPVVPVRGGQPDVQVHVDVAVGDALEGRRDVDLLDGDRVALLLQDHLPQVGDGDVLLPGDHRDADLLAAAFALLRAGGHTAATAAAGSGEQGDRGGGRPGCEETVGSGAVAHVRSLLFVLGERLPRGRVRVRPRGAGHLAARAARAAGEK